MGKRKHSEEQSSRHVKIVVAEKQTQVEPPYLGTKAICFTKYKIAKVYI